MSNLPAPSRREVLAATAVLLAVGVAAYGWWVLHGGFYGDDWGNADAYRFADAPRYWTAVRSGASSLGGRPVLAALLPLPHALFGLHPSLHLALGVALALSSSLCFYVLVRLLGLESVDAAAIAVLGLLFPWADAIELWPTASLNTVAVTFFFLGVVIALLGLRRRGRSGVALHAAAASLYLLSVLTYEAAGAAAVLTGLLYLRRAPRSQALLRWSVDVVVVTGGLVYSLIRTSPVRHVGTLHQRIADVPTMTRQSVSLFASALVPVSRAGSLLHPLVVLVVAAIVVVLVVRVLRGTRDRSLCWLYFGGGCVAAVAAAYFMFLGSYLHPLDPATGTRTNVFARFAYAGLVYAVVAATMHLIARTPRAARLTTLAVAGLIAIGYSVRLASDESAWVRASRLQGKVLAAIDARFPHLKPGTTLATFNFPAEVWPGAPIFVATWDLTGALQIKRHDSTLHAFPVYWSVRVRCQANQAVIHLPGSRGTATARYGKLFFLEVPSGRVARISSVGSCTRAVTRFQPGPYFAT